MNTRELGGLANNQGVSEDSEEAPTDAFSISMCIIFAFLIIYVRLTLC